MKINCPVCSRTIYTNPFDANQQMTCPECGARLEREEKSSQLLQAVLAVSVVAAAILESILAVFLPTETAILIAACWLLGGAMFELPQRWLYRRRLLRYRRRP